jgi:hypothetical protein
MYNGVVSLLVGAQLDDRRVRDLAPLTFEG